MVEDQFRPTIAVLFDRSLVAVRRKSVGIRASESSKRMLSVTLRDSVWRVLDHAAYEIRMQPYELARVILNIIDRSINGTARHAYAGQMRGCARGMRALIALAFLLSGCNSNGIPAPSVGQWVAYGGTEPTINQGPPMSFAFPGPNRTAGYFYTQLPIVPKTGQTLTLTFSVDGSNPVWQNNPNGGDSGAPTMHLFLWHKGDDLSCNGDLAQYRMFAARTPLVLGDNQIISVPLTTDAWTGCYAAQSTDAQWSDLLNNLLGAGFTFGGRYFAGHGIYLSAGSATFKVNSFTVQ